MIEALKKNRFLRYVNNLPFLQRELYQGTSGIGLISRNVDSFVNIYNSLYFYEGENIGPQKLILSDSVNKVSIPINLFDNESKIFRLSDYFEPTQELKPIACRVYNENHPQYVPYFYSSIFCKQSQDVSVVHSSSFGNSSLKENIETYNFRSFEKDTLCKSDLILLALYPHAKGDKNKFKINIRNVNNETKVSFDENFSGDVCKIALKNYVNDLSEDGFYRISFKGPVTANPYLLLNDQTLFHI